MKSVIVGTAGHIDHGKTALVKALTGIDADRLEEEKRRGITIDIGFAHLIVSGENGQSFQLGFVDVPGHERFVRNMLAGVGGIDLVLLVIAADESIKPQTREHFDICRLLGVQRGITVLTKSDAVDADTLEVTRLEIEEFVRGSFLDSSMSPIVSVSSLTGAGIDELKLALAKAAAEVPAKDATAWQRLPVDRVFSIKGFGTVVTGTLVAGSIRKEDEMEIFPQRQLVRVRGVQVHGEPVEAALAGQRTALNLAGVTKEELARGMFLTQPATFEPTSRVDVSISLLPSAKSLKDGARVHFHAYTSETIATVLVFESKQVALGDKAYAQLRLSQPMLLLPGDRFILRQFSPVVTIGGGVVLDAFPLPKSRKEGYETDLRVFDRSDGAEILQHRVARRGQSGLRLSQAVVETGWREDKVKRLAVVLIQQNQLLPIRDIFLAVTAMSSLKIAMIEAAKAFHTKNPLVAGMSKEVLREECRAIPEIFAAALECLATEKKVEVAGEVVRLAGRSVVMKDEEAESKDVIEAAFASAGLKVPALKEVLMALKIDKVRAQKIVTLLLRDKALVKVSEDLVFHHNALQGLRQRMAAEKIKSPKMDVARFKEVTGVSRKYAIPLLEYLDREHVTKRVGDERVIL